MSFQPARVTGLQRGGQLGAGSPACRASVPLLHGPILGTAVAMEAAQSRDLTAWEVLGGLFLIYRDTAEVSCKPIVQKTSLDWMVLYPVLPGYHEDDDFCFLWGCARRDFVHLDLIPCKLQYSIHLRLVFLLYTFYTLFHVFQWEVTQDKGGWNGWPPAKPSCHSPESFPTWEAVSPRVSPAPGQPWELLQLRCCSLSE